MSRGQALGAGTGWDTCAPATSAPAGIGSWPDEPAPVQLASEQRAPEQRTPEQRVPEQRAPTSHAPEQRAPEQRRRIDADPESVERGLVSLVLTVVELLRQLMERQALRRVDQGTLSDDQVENIGRTLMALENRMGELRDHFGLAPEDLNLDLGPLGPLLPYE